MLLRKATGGCTVAGFTWDKDGAVVEVPAHVADELLAIRGGDFSAADEDKKEVTEPAPRAKAAVTEPAPRQKAAATEGKPARKPAAK
jgi:hypothetical protein